MVRRPLVQLKPKADPDYPTLVAMFQPEAKRSLTLNLESIQDPALRMLVAAFRHNLRELPEALYEAARKSPEHFTAFFRKFLHTCSTKKARARFVRWAGNSRPEVPKMAELADFFEVPQQSISKSIKAVSECLASQKFLDAASQELNIYLPKPNTTDYRQVKKSLLIYSDYSHRPQLFSKPLKVRLMMLLFAHSPQLFTEAIYEHLKQDDNARDAVEVILDEFFDTETDRCIVRDYFGIGTPITSAATVARVYGVSKTTVYRRVAKFEDRCRYEFLQN